MKKAAIAIKITETVFIVNEVIIGLASFFKAGRFAENRISGMPTHTSIDEKSEASDIFAPPALNTKLNSKPDK
jgi:hypothetical protein